MPVFRKSRRGVPPRYFAWEAAGLRWLAEAEPIGGIPVVPVVDVGSAHLHLARLDQLPPSRAAAAQFGERLAITHERAGRDESDREAAYGLGPPGWSGDGYFGPLSEPLPLALAPFPTWHAMYAAARLAPITRACRDVDVFDAKDALLLDRVMARLDRWDTDEPAGRIHGDLWSGNVLWTPAGATLIDPAAHHGHREADLAMLALFGSPHLEVTLAAYDEVRPLADGWRERIGLHQLYPLAVHALLFGGGYAAQTLAVARRYA